MRLQTRKNPAARPQITNLVKTKQRYETLEAYRAYAESRQVEANLKAQQQVSVQTRRLLGFKPIW
ncbi:MAG: hypothetical protein R3236_02745 [Phycisphaeraceae bacterium]|nr:hypothetical protein [Phycisphaeraceae bacterium]